MIISSFTYPTHILLIHQNQQTEGIALPNSPNAQYAPFPTMNSAAHQYGSLTGTPGTSSSSGTGSSPSKTPKRPRNSKRDAETKGLRNKVTDACERTPINLVHVGSMEFARRQRDAIDHCSRAEVYQHPVYKLVPHLFHLHIFDSTATPAQLPQFKKNAMLDTRQLYRTWNIILRNFI